MQLFSFHNFIFSILLFLIISLFSNRQGEDEKKKKKMNCLNAQMGFSIIHFFFWLLCTTFVIELPSNLFTRMFLLFFVFLLAQFSASYHARDDLSSHRFQYSLAFGMSIATVILWIHITVSCCCFFFLKFKVFDDLNFVISKEI